MSRLTQKRKWTLLALPALLAFGLASRTAELSGPQITSFQYKPDGTVSVAWTGASKRIVVEVSSSVTPANWQRVPGVDWPIDASSWTGSVPRSRNYGFLRVLAIGEPGVALPSKTISLDLMSIHDPGSAKYNTNCIGCHGDRTKEVALDGKTPTAHSRMLSLFGSRNNRCVLCHTAPDFLSHSAGGLREQVNMAGTECFSCHGKGVKPEFYAK